MNDFDLVVSLSNHLSGFVSFDRISSTLSAHFAAVAGVAEEKETEVGEQKLEIPSLTSYYQPGDVVVASLFAVESQKTGRQRRRLELSLRPEHVNEGCSAENLTAGMVVSGEICSREDRGYTVSLGLPTVGSAEFVGFLPEENSTADLRPGKTISCLVAASFDNRKSRVVTLSVATATTAMTVFKESADVTSLRCGTLVNAQIKSVEEGYLSVAFSGHQGRIDLLNLPDAVMLRRQKKVELADSFTVGKKIAARIIFADLEEKQFLLSAKTSLIEWAPKMESERIGLPTTEAIIFRIDQGLGVVISLGEASFAYVHISRLADERVEKIEGQYKVGTAHPARIIGFDAFSGLYQASLRPSTLKEQVLRIEDVHPGQDIRAEVAKIEPFGLIVTVNERIRAVCPNFHLTEVHSEKAGKTYQIGQKYKFRIVDCDPKTRRITLSRKKGLLDSKIAPLTDYSQAVVGNLHDGFIVAIKKFGCIVRFYADVKGIVTVAEMTDEYVDCPQDSYFVGQAVKCRILKCDPSTKQLLLSLRKQTGPKVRLDADGAVIQNKRQRIDVELEADTKASGDGIVTLGTGARTLDDFIHT